jgi:hypothetical protein
MKRSFIFKIFYSKNERQKLNWSKVSQKVKKGRLNIKLCINFIIFYGL